MRGVIQMETDEILDLIDREGEFAVKALNLYLHRREVNSEFKLALLKAIIDKTIDGVCEVLNDRDLRNEIENASEVIKKVIDIPLVMKRFGDEDCGEEQL